MFSVPVCQKRECSESSTFPEKSDGAFWGSSFSFGNPSPLGLQEARQIGILWVLESKTHPSFTNYLVGHFEFWKSFET